MIRESKLSLDIQEFYTVGRGLQAGCRGVDGTQYRVETVTKQTGPIRVFREYKVVRDPVRDGASRRLHTTLNLQSRRLGMGKQSLSI